jgi:hypothetical protein
MGLRYIGRAFFRVFQPKGFKRGFGALIKKNVHVGKEIQSSKKLRKNILGRATGDPDESLD